jgi:hypothetical protein
MSKIFFGLVSFISLISISASHASIFDRATLYACGPISNGRVIWEQDSQLKLSRKKVTFEISPRNTFHGTYSNNEDKPGLRAYVDPQFRTDLPARLMVQNLLFSQPEGQVVLQFNDYGTLKIITFQCRAYGAEG